MENGKGRPSVKKEPKHRLGESRPILTRRRLIAYTLAATAANVLIWLGTHEPHGDSGGEGDKQGDVIITNCVTVTPRPVNGHSEAPGVYCGGNFIIEK